MVFTKAAFFTLLSFGLAATRATAVTTCAGLIEAVGSASTVTLEGNFPCSEPITIYSGGVVTVSGPYTITIDTDFAGTLKSLFVTEAGGALTLDGLTIKSGAVGGIRAVHNEGTLTVKGCTFSSLSGEAETMLSTGGVVSRCGGCLRTRARTLIPDTTESVLRA